MNQHYSHIAALALAHLTHATAVVWPAMQERSSFNNRYHPDAAKNMQSWQYLDASTLWDLDRIKQRVHGKGSREGWELKALECSKWSGGRRSQTVPLPVPALRLHSMCTPFQPLPLVYRRFRDRRDQAPS